MKRTISLSSIALLVLVSLLGSGCKEDGKFYTLEIIAGTDVASATIDIIGISADNKQDWARINPEDYFKGENPFRQRILNGNGCITTNLGVLSTKRYVLDLKVPAVKQIWEDKWRRERITELLLMVKTSEARNKYIPLKPSEIKEKYGKAKAFQVILHDVGFIEVKALPDLPKQSDKSGK